MTARILIVDDLPSNLKLLQAKLAGEYYEVISASSGDEAIRLAKSSQPDIILLDVMMPDKDGYETCKILKSDPITTYIPVVMITALDDVPENRIPGFNSGADDFLTKPINDIALFARIRSLTRLKFLIDELMLRGQTNLEFDTLGHEIMDYASKTHDAQILLLDNYQERLDQIMKTIKKHFLNCDILSFAHKNSIEKNYDLIIIALSVAYADSLRICSQFRNSPISRYTPILLLLDEDEKDIDTEILVKAFDIGVNDYIVMPIKENELIARITLQIKRKRYQDALKMSLNNDRNLAIHDSLTNCYNRRYFDMHFSNLITSSSQKHKCLSLIMLDIDCFKEINDTFGHTAGDGILQKIQQIIATNIRITDLLARYGGDEFVVILPDTDLTLAARIAERIRDSVEDDNVTPPTDIKSTISIGVAEMILGGDNAQDFLKRADKCLYRAKKEGKNKIAY